MDGIAEKEWQDVRVCVVCKCWGFGLLCSAAIFIYSIIESRMEKDQPLSIYPTKYDILKFEVNKHTYRIIFFFFCFVHNISRFNSLFCYSYRHTIIHFCLCVSGAAVRCTLATTQRKKGQMWQIQRCWKIIIISQSVLNIKYPFTMEPLSSSTSI